MNEWAKLEQMRKNDKWIMVSAGVVLGSVILFIVAAAVIMTEIGLLD
jgi:hypothetical protein